MVLKLRHRLRHFFDILDEEGVGIFQAIVYIHIALGGLYVAVVSRKTPDVVESTMGSTVNGVWVALCGGAVICLAGKMMSGTGWANVGIWCQLTGDIFVATTLWAYVIATVATRGWGANVWAVWIVAAIADCVVLLIVRDGRRIVQVETRAHR